jgi:hypothetical protein
MFHGHSIEASAKPRPADGLAQRKIFLLSSANASGSRAKSLLRPDATSALSQRLRDAGAPLGEVYRFISSLYFRGKLAYAEKFQNPPVGAHGVYIITAAAGLMLPSATVTLSELEKNSLTPVRAANRDYREPLERDLLALRSRIDPGTEIILLGSVATPKYVEPLLGIFQDQLLFPADFAGRGDMSRGGLLVRCVANEVELRYIPVGSSERRAPRPAKLPPQAKVHKRTNISQ